MLKSSLLLSLLSATAFAAPYGRGDSYDRDEGDIISTMPGVLNVSGISLDRGILTINGSSGADTASVAPGLARGTIVAKRGNYSATYDASDVSKIVFNGNDGDDTFTNTTSIPCEAYGNDGNDVLNGGSGLDSLQGDSGADQFLFDSALNAASNLDHILDFTHGSDKIVLENSVFATLATGALSANAFVLGAAAADADDRILYDAATGNLYFDADGTGATAKILFATLDTHPILTASDFQVI